MYKHLVKSIQLRNRNYRVIYQSDSDYRLNLVDVLCIRLDDHHLVRIIGYNPENDSFDELKDYGLTDPVRTQLIKSDFFYGSYKC